MSENSNSEPIGALKAQLVGQIKKQQTTGGLAIVKKAAFGSVELPKPTVTVTRPIVSRSENVGPRVQRAQPMVSRPIEVPTTAAPKPLAVADLKTELLKEVETEVDTAATAAEAEKLRKRLARAEVAGAYDGPIDPSAIVEAKQFFREDAKPIQQQILKKPTEIEPADGIYVPQSSPRFQDFIIQTYAQYSPFLSRVLKEGRAAAEAPKLINKEACKERDPDNVQTFYYQKFVRDYLSKGTPYRGLLVYHGLGSGKTCTSIAAAEALYWGGKKTVFVLTPATLSNNYRRELAKCGYFPLSTNNYWQFLEYKVSEGKKPEQVPQFIWLRDVLGLPPALIEKQRGGWVPSPPTATRPSNWSALSAESREAIRAQQKIHMETRFKIIHYNGVQPAVLSELASSGVRSGRSIFDDAVVVIDEIHNLVRTINGTSIGGKPISTIIDKVEPREFTWTAPMAQERPGFRYPRGYTLYRLLQNAVGAKIIALSATPMINYAQELAILMNIIGGEQRVLEISLKGMARDPMTLKKLTAWAKQNPEIDFWKVEEGADRSSVLTVSPVPYGFAKVIDEATGESRGFLRLPPSRIVPIETSNERNMDLWGVSQIKQLEEAGVLPTGGAEEALTAITAARAKGPGPAPTVKSFKLFTYPMLPEDPKVFVNNFVDRNTLKILKTPILKSRALGMISYYRGGSEELMPRVGRNEVVDVPMSDYMFQQYSRVRLQEIEREKPKDEVTEGVGRKGMTTAEADLYAQATKTLQTGFLALSRAGCNWVFPEEVPRPSGNDKDMMRLRGITQDATVAVDAELDVPIAPKKTKTAAAGGGEEGAEATDAVLPDEAAPVVEEPIDSKLQGIIGSLMSGLEAKGDDYLNRNLATYSPKYAAMIANIKQSAGPALVYSQFKTLEGLGIFAAALRASDDRYLPLDLEKSPEGDWVIPDVLMETGRSRYILYTGDQDLEKRRLLLQLYNADVGGLPPRLSEQCRQLLAGAPDNRDGRICRVFMITQSGAEGISLFNTRQVHIMEPYWNNVRLQQVIGRAIRLCSHMNLPWDDRVVDIFTYRSVFSTKQKAEGSRQLMMADKTLTTDQMIFDIAVKKQKLADGLFEIAQTAAVDCELHLNEHGGAIQCFRFPTDGRLLFTHHPNWEKDVQSIGAFGGK